MLVFSPILVPLLTALFAVLLKRNQRIQHWLSIAGAAAFLFCAVRLVHKVVQSGTVSVALGDWPLPYSIELVADGLSTAMVLVTAILGLGVLVYQISTPDPAGESSMLHPLVQGLLAAVSGTILTADLFNLYVWFEFILITVLGLLVIGGGGCATRKQLSSILR